MDQQLKLCIPQKSTLLISISVLTAGYLALKVNFWEAWRTLFNPVLIYTRIEGVKDTVTDTEDYSFELLRFLDKLHKSQENEVSNNGSSLEIIFSRPPGHNGELTDYKEDYNYRLLHLPPFGDTQYNYKGRKFYLRRFTSHECLLYTFKWNRVLMNQLLEEVLQLHKKRSRGELLGFFYLDSTLDWKLMGSGSGRKRPLETVILKEGVKESLLQDVKEFLSCKDWYMEKGVPYRRGYLLHGPPGTGKTSVICALAGEIGYDICILSLSSSFLTDDDLTIAMNKVHTKCIVLIEDIDAAFKSKEFESDGSETSSLSKITFKGILNALDGVTSQEGRIVFITTNHIKKLDSALIRPGRVDVKILIDHATRSQVEKMFARFYPQLGDEVQDSCREKLTNQLGEILTKLDKKVSMACVQGLFILYKNDPKAAIESAEEHFEKYKDDDNNEFLNCYV